MPLPRDPRDDDAQVDALTLQRAERAEMRRERREARILLAGIVAVHGFAYTFAAILTFGLVVAWHDTGDRRFFWPILLLGGGVAYGVASTFVTHREVEL